MTRTRQHPEQCPQCLGNHYVLVNREGWVRAEPCPCFHCKECGDAGRIFREDEKGMSYLIPCICTEFRRRLALLGEASIPGKYRNASLETFHPLWPLQKTALSRTQDFIEDFMKDLDGFNKGLVFMGDTGAGKTHLAVATIKKLVLSAGIDCKFVDFFQLLSEIRHGYSQDLSEQAIIQPYLRARVLVIDELAKGRNNEFEANVLDQFISHRYNSGNKVTLFTTNYLNTSLQGKDAKAKESDKVDTGSGAFREGFRKETLQDRVGDRVFSRIAESSRFLELKGGDFRQNVKHVSPSRNKK